MNLISLEVSGQPELEAKLKSLQGALNTRDILDEGSALLFNRMRTRFLSEMDPTGAKWLPSKAAIRRKATGKGGGTLFDTGKMFRSLQLFSVDENSRAIGTDATSQTGFPYPKAHQYGWGGVRRIFLGFGDEDVQLMSNLIVRRIVNSLV